MGEGGEPAVLPAQLVLIDVTSGMQRFAGILIVAGLFVSMFRKHVPYPGYRCGGNAGYPFGGLVGWQIEREWDAGGFGCFVVWEFRV